MEKGAVQYTQKVSFGESAVIGLFRGLLGGVVMGAVIAVGSLVAGQRFSYLGDFTAGAPVSPLQGFLMHLGTSGVFGILYALIYHAMGKKRLDKSPGWLVGLLYAMLLYAFAVTVLLPATDSLLVDIPWLVFFLGHIAFGVTLGIQFKTSVWGCRA